MMKHFKLLVLSFALVAGLFTSCSNNEPISEDQNIQETQAITESLNRLAGQFDTDGNVIASANPAGNIVFDFGFDFVYPITLAYNNTTTVTVNSLEDLIQVIINSTDDLYIDGIEFPFDIEVYDEETDSIVIITITNEEEFIDFLDSLNWETQDNCNCTDEFDPVCVEVTDPTGNTFIVTYPNSCYAFCDGFDDNDFVDNCEDDYNSNGANDCFTFNFPIDLITDQNQTVTVNSQEEFDVALYNSYYFDFVYPFEVTTTDGDVVVINNGEDFISVLDDCYTVGNCDCYQEYDPVCAEVETPTGGVQIVEFINECYAVCEGIDPADFVDCETTGECNCEDEYNPVCVEVENPLGNTEIIEFPNACYAECEGFTEVDFIDCSGNTSDCTTEDVALILVECPWTVNSSATYDFIADGSVGITGSGLSTVGSWSIYMSNNGYPIVSISAEIGNFNDDWHFLDCNQVNSLIVSSSTNPAAEIVMDCD